MIVLALAGSVLAIDGSFLFIFFSIILLIWILNRTLFKPINQILDERDRLGVGRLAEAKKLLAQHEEHLNKVEEQLRAARAEAYQQLEAQRRESQTARHVLIAEIKAEAVQQVTAAKEEIAKQAVEAQQNLETEARAMAATISSQILHRPVSAGGN